MGGDLLFLARDEGLWSLPQATISTLERIFSIKGMAAVGHRAVPVVAFGFLL